MNVLKFYSKLPKSSKCYFHIEMKQRTWLLLCEMKTVLEINEKHSIQKNSKK